MSELTFITGPMYASKTTELLSLLRRESISGKKVILIKPTLDNRYDEASVVTHDGLSYPSFSFDTTLSFSENIENLNPEQYNSYMYADVIGFDEVQFFPTEITNEIESLLIHGIKVICAGLNLSANKVPYKVSEYLLNHSDVLNKKTAICHRCGEEAIYTKYIGEENSDEIIIGGLEKYQARCRRCYL